MVPPYGSDERIRRRRFLRSVGVAGMVGIAGCSGDDDTDTETQQTATTTPSGSAPTATPASSAPTATATPLNRPSTTTATMSTGTPAGGEETPAGTPTQETPTPTVEDTPAETPVDDGPSTEELESQVSDVSFGGRLLDTHVHWHGARNTRHDILDPGTLATRYGSEEVGAAALFASTDVVSSGYESVLQTLADSAYDYLPFLEPDTFEHLVQGGVTELYESYPDVFAGIGEIVFYAGPMQGTALTADPWPELFGFAAEKDIPLMIHPTQEQEAGLKTMLGRYPEATVMAHGGEFNLARQKLEPILRNNENLYWTLDAGSMLNGLVLRASDASDFVSQYESRESDFKGLVQRTLPWMMDAAPDRVMWGTDLATDWNTDPEVISVVMEWTQAALDSLSADQQDKYASQNAKRLFGL